LFLASNPYPPPAGENTDWFSLGFNTTYPNSTPVPPYVGGWITLEFEHPILNGDGNDFTVYESSSEDYVNVYKEFAEVYASQDGIDWTLIGIAGNQPPEAIRYYENGNPTLVVYTEFDLSELPWAKYIKIQDISDPTIRYNIDDAFDVNAVQALHDIIEEETAWGEGEDFPGNDWSMYFDYTILCIPEASWADFSSLPGYYSEPEEITLCDGKTITIEIANNSNIPYIQFDGGTVTYPFFTEEHSVFENINDIDYKRFRTRAASAEGNFNNAAPNSYTMTWTFDTPLDHNNFFVVGQLLQGNVATITAYDTDENVVNSDLAFEQLKAVKSTFTFYEPLSWTASTGVLKKNIAAGSNSKYGFFSIPEGTEIGKIVIALADDGTRGNSADEVNYGIGCYDCFCF
jgi:hypothetical protein